MLGVTPEMAFFFYSFFKLSIFCRSDEKFDGVCQQLHQEQRSKQFEYYLSYLVLLMLFQQSKMPFLAVRFLFLLKMFVSR